MRSPQGRAVLASLRTAPLNLFLLGCVAVLLGGCSRDSNPTKPETATSISGRVVYSDDTNRGVPDAVVHAINKSGTTTTDSTGGFSLTIDASDGEVVQITIGKPGFDDATRSLTVQKGAVNRLSASIPLSHTGSGGSGGSGVPANIALHSVSSTHIGVMHGGDAEEATLVFEVRDADGRLVDFGHRASLRFTLFQVAGGGATLSPDTLSTDSNGLAAVTLKSGTLAQAVQIRAQVTGTAIVSDPVRIAIHGGLPDAAHFGYAVAPINIAGLVFQGITDRVTALVGDRYGNPVQTGTAVYFTTTGGIIFGSALTDDHGFASVDLVTGNPDPNASPAFTDSAGIARITAQTMDENRNPLVLSRLAVMFSGHTELAIAPTSFAVPLGGFQDFNITVRDVEHHNPLVAGTQITVTTTVGGLGADADVTLPDTWDQAYTHFTVRLSSTTNALLLIAPDGRALRFHESATTAQLASTPVAVSDTKQATLTVKVTSTNGNVQQSVYGTVTLP